MPDVKEADVSGWGRAREVEREIMHRFSPLIGELNVALIEAHQQGIDVSIEIGHCQGIMIVQANINGPDTVGGRTLAKSHGLIS